MECASCKALVDSQEARCARCGASGGASARPHTTVGGNRLESRRSVSSSGVSNGANDPPPARVAGEVVAGRYSLLASIGRGGQGDVWEAEDRVTGERVAVKILPPAL